MEFRRFTDTKQQGWDKLWALYENSFPECERRTLRDHTEAMCDPDFHVMGVWDEGAFAGLLFYWYNGGFCYVEHFAINGTIRGKGYGTRTLEMLCGQYPLVILEIEVPVDEMTRRRQRFYERAGFCGDGISRNHSPYRLGDPPHELLTLSYPDVLTPERRETFLAYWETRVMRYSEPGRGSRG